MDSYLTISAEGCGKYVEKMSRFLSFAMPVGSADEARTVISRLANTYHDARHVCWAYMVGSDRDCYQCSDNGEPSGTAGKPILGQINSFGLTNVAVAVVRYFGGIKLGTGGLVVAYREAARLALEDAPKVERACLETIRLRFAYLDMNAVMRLVKQPGFRVVDQQFDNTCTMVLEVPRTAAGQFAPYLDT